MNIQYCFVVNLLVKLQKISESFEKEVKQIQQIIIENFNLLLGQIKEQKFLEIVKVSIQQKILLHQNKYSQIQNNFFPKQKVQLLGMVFNVNLQKPSPKLNNLKKGYFSSQQIFDDFIEFNI
ncbi:unnamed protein product [Paramecium sonneborni]|uniref:Uncharacterized protein n=1 Tax=Paramecium sonneborni TaxID=65129 RepID=A0A8S1N9B2_9CILI|nr:unnamed protein product [Paramecium sonneborni]